MLNSKSVLVFETLSCTSLQSFKLSNSFMVVFMLVFRMLLEIDGVEGIAGSIVCVGMSGSFTMSKLADAKSLLSL